MQNSHGAEPAAHLTVEEDAEYRSDSFRMNNMKVLPCSKRFVHDWTECPFAHPQEKARRRDPRVHSYTGIACPSMKKEGCCAFGDHCPYAHNVFEYWLHPTRYRTQLCNDGSNCKRKICFFAHSLDELRVPACKPFVSPEALAAAAASAANDAEAKRKAATVGSPMSAFASASGGPSPQRTSLEAMRSGSGGGGSAPGPQSSGGADTVMGASPGDAALHQALQQLMGAGFSSKDQQVIELVTSLLAQDRVSPEQAASILQQMLPANALNTLQARLNTPRGSMEEARCYSDPLGYRSDSGGLQHQHMRPASFDSLGGGGQSYGDSFGASPHTVSAMPGQGQSPGLEHMAAMHAAQHMGTANMYRGGIGQFQATPSGMQGMDASHRASLESARSSFDTGAQQLLTVSCSSSESEDGIVANNNRPDADAAAAGASQQQRSQQQQAQQQQQSAAQQRSPADGATRKAPAEQGSSSSGRQPAASTEQSHRAALQTILLQRQQMQQLQQQHALARPSEDSSRMSFEHGSMDLGTPRNSLDTTFPPNLNLMSSGSLPGPYFSGTLTTVPEQFPMINAPPPPSSWNSSQQHRFSYDSPAAADRLSQDLGRMSFDAGSAGSGPARVAPQTANPFTSSFFAAGAPTGMTAAERLSGPNPVGERRPLTLPPLPTVRTSSAARSPSLEKEDAAAAHQQLFGGAVLQRLQ